MVKLMGPVVRRGVSSSLVALVAASFLVMALGTLIGVVYQGGSGTPTNATGPPQPGLNYFQGKTSFINGGPPCGTCHQILDIGVGGGSVGPDLSNILNTAFSSNATKLSQFLTKPTTPTMKATWGSAPLTDQEVTALVDLIKYAASHSK
jgi:cytochrome c551/c552